MKATVKTKNKGSLNMRDKPSSGGVILAKIPYGTTIEIIPVDDDWCSVTYSEREGYVRREYLDEEVSEPKPPVYDLQAIYDDLKTLLKNIEKLLNK